MAKHADEVGPYLHVVHNWTYADATARLAATGFVPGDVHKLALQLDTFALWMLTDDDPITWQLTSSGGSGTVTASGTPTSGQIAEWTSATNVQGKAVTGTGDVVLANGGTLIAPVLGTPASGTLTNATGLPVATGISGLGTGVATALAVNVGSAGAPVVNGGALGTPSSGTLTNCSGLPATTGITGVIPIANLATGTPDGTKFIKDDGTLATPSGGSGGGTKTLARWTALDNQPPSANFATFDTRNSIAVLDFDAATAESAVFVGIIPEAASFATGMKVILKWMATSATSGDVIWTAALERGTTDLDSDSFATGVDFAASTANGTSGIPTSVSLDLNGTTEIDSIVAGDLFRLKITRKAADGSDTMTGDAELIAVEIQQR